MSATDATSIAPEADEKPRSTEANTHSSSNDGRPSAPTQHFSAQIVIAVFTAIAAGVSAFSAWNSSRTARESVTLTQQNIKWNRDVYAMNERPWAGVKEVVLTEPLRSGHAATVSVVIINIGKTPVQNMELSSSFTLMDTFADEKTKFDTGSPGNGSNGILFPGTERRTIDSTPEVLSRTDIAALAEGKLFLYEAGTLDYEDAFHQKHVTQFCYMYRPDLAPRFAFCPHGNSAT
jgi:hypothetical protein